MGLIQGPIHPEGYRDSVLVDRSLGIATSKDVEYLTVDSGACDSISHPAAFPNTKTKFTSEHGKSYGACGGETVVNMGTKTVRCLTKER